jgi:hypothetical protein
MELDYFISQSSRATLSQKDKWLDSSSIVTRSFQPSKAYRITGLNSGNSDFSIFFTFNRMSKFPSLILSNYVNQSGFFIGLNDTNKIFALASKPNIDSYTFNGIDLSAKNCLAIIKSNNRLTLFNYDLNSREVYQTDSFSFKSDTQVSGGNFVIGKATGEFPYPLSGLSGIFDQLVVFNQSLDLEDAKTIFSGFLPLSKSTITVYGYKYYENSELNLKEGSILSYQDAENFIPFMDYLDTSAVPLSTGNYMAEISGTARYNVFDIVWTGYYTSGDQLTCSFTGSRTLVGGNYGAYSPTISENLMFTDKIYVSMNSSSERVTSHLFSFYTTSYPDIDDYFSYNKVAKYSTKTVDSFSTSSTSYISGFYMSGVVVDKTFCNLLRYSDKTFLDVGIELPFDVAKQRFVATEDFEEGYNLYWGYDKIESYYKSGQYIETSAVDEDKSFKMIFDKSVSDPKYVHTSINYATGAFPRGAAVVLAGDTVSRNSFREQKRDFFQTCHLDKLHARKNKSIGSTYEDIMINSNLNWSGSMTPITILM